MKITKKSYVWVCALALSAANTACGPKRQVGYVKSGSAGAGLSGYWSEGDAERVVKTMTGQMLSTAWVGEFRQNESRKPVVKLRGVIKRTDDRNVNTQYFSKQLERTLLNSGQVRVVAAAGQDNINVSERNRQAVHASDESAKSQQAELGADFTLQTVINSQNDTDGGGRTLRAYLVNMELLSVETNEKVWIGEEKIVKNVQQAGTRW
ncbi:MAG: penicillin-binding protein activator LpoB [Myxococcota bacterium]